ncbi:MAG TPA: alpha-1,4-glucan--maltose-1-phosphate maltosyltransferase [Casimicrobiaceae bacterium]|nr:alpha-1,4-glucan--maltose-1-phosphate maltosyltransferase [Casimicrobiaceae bacterium]
MSLPKALDGRRRAVIENVAPGVDGGRFAAKRCVGDTVVVEADVFVDGHESLRAVLLHRRRGEPRWNESEMTFLVNDHWRGEFAVTELGAYEFTVTAWPDAFLTWRHDLSRWTAVDDVIVALQVGVALLRDTVRRTRGADAARLREWIARLTSQADPLVLRSEALDDALMLLVERYADRRFATTHEPPLPVWVDPVQARFSAWYEMFPRSAGSGGRHASFAECEARLPEIAEMGFDVLYFPPIHPIGRTKRKGRNNALVASEGDPGSPWAIGASEGGHKAIHPQLGSPEDFRRLVRAARERGIEVALDIAFQCSPDHPYVKEHPEWFRHRPDGSIQYAENPPKKYQDIYPFNFDTDQWRALWEELKSIFDHWIGEGVRVFRVDNPHTKPFAFWQWLIGEVKQAHPEVMFLSEAFTRPRPMHRLAKLGFTQSYTYFAWRNSKQELIDYFTELTQAHSREYFRPNVWPNTPDILTAYLQTGGRAAFIARLILASTLSASYGVYGPAFELLEHLPREPGSEEYLHSEKYEIRDWQRDAPESLAPIMARVNVIRRANKALQQDWNLRFHATDNPQVICYSKATADGSNVILVVVNLDPYHKQSAFVELALAELGVDAMQPFDIEDLLTAARYTWRSARNYVELRPQELPAHVFRVTPRVRREAQSSIEAKVIA